MNKWKFSGLPAMVLAFVVGVVVGLVVLGWWLWPVKWTNAAPAHLHPTYQEDYLRMAIDSYQVNRNPGLARQRFEALGEEGPRLLAEIQANPGPQDPKAIQAFAMVVAEAGPAAEAPEGPPARVLPQGLGMTMMLCLVLAALVVAGGLSLFLVRRRKRGQEQKRQARKEAKFQEAVEAAPAHEGEEALSHYTTTYEFGNDYFDESFAVETAAGEFLGECGINLTEALAPGTPRQAAAFEVWLFDKSDIQTVTKVLVVPDLPEDLRSQLANKGDLVVLEGPGQTLELETSNLRAHVRVQDVQFGQGERGRFVEYLAVEFVVFQKQPSADTQPLAA